MAGIWTSSIFSRAGAALRGGSRMGAYPATPVRRKPSLDFSLTGLVYSSMMLFMGLAAINTQANLLFGVFGLMIGILLVSGIISRLVLRRLKVKRSMPHQGHVGQPLTVTYEFINAKRYWPSLSVCLAELDGAQGFTKQPQCYLLHAAARMSAGVAAEFVPKRRGLHEFRRYQVSTSFPFGFIKRAVIDAQPDRVLIFPPIGQVSPRLLAMCRSADKTGPMTKPRPGGQDEFYGVREHRRGESPRTIYWKRSARGTGTLVAKQMSLVSPPRVLIVVDTHLPGRTLEEHVQVERAIAMAASFAASAIERDVSVGLFTWSGDWLGLQPSRGKRHGDDVLSVLARLPLNTQHDAAALLDRCEAFLGGGTTILLFTPRDVQMGLSDHARGAMIVVSATSAQANAWFRFPDTIDFTTCMPEDQQPKIAAPAGRASPPAGAPAR